MDKTKLLGKAVRIKKSGEIGNIVAVDDSNCYPFYINAHEGDGFERGSRICDFDAHGMKYADGFPKTTEVQVYDRKEFDLIGETLSQPKKLKVYYAHFMGIYNTYQEARDIAMLEGLGFEVVNPNTPEISASCKKAFEDDAMSEVGIPYETTFDKVFGKLVRECDLLAYRALPDGRIGGGVALEIEYANLAMKPVIQLPGKSDLLTKKMSGEETRAYLYDMGVR